MKSILRALTRWRVRRGGREWPATRLTISGTELAAAGLDAGTFATVTVTAGTITITAAPPAVSLTTTDSTKVAQMLPHTE